jgi:hypothetical protein
MDLKETGWEVCTGFIWLRKEIRGFLKDDNGHSGSV